MSKIDKFVADARAQGVPEQAIRNTLLSADWTESDVDRALLGGLEVPRPDETNKKSSSTGHSRPSLGSLEATLLHVLLWFFVAASTIAISAVASSLFGGSVSSEALAAMMAVSVITFTPYAIFFVRYLRRLRSNPQLIPGRIWSIITICIHSIGAMIAGITLVVGAIIDSGPSVIVGSSLVLILNAIVLISYSAGAFSRPSKKRRLALTIHLFALALLLGSLFVTSLIRLVPSQTDSQTREHLVESVEEVKDFAGKHNKLPTQDELSLPDGVTYRPINSHTYEVCADFKLNSTSGDSDTRPPFHDSFVSIYDFSEHKKGNDCFEFHSSSLMPDKFDPTFPEPIEPYS